VLLWAAVDQPPPSDDGSGHGQLGKVGSRIGVEHDRVRGGTVDQAGHTKVRPSLPGGGGQRLGYRHTGLDEGADLIGHPAVRSGIGTGQHDDTGFD
jgi:hypothetical protein